jgi:methionyl-tRNA formyltransferase
MPKKLRILFMGTPGFAVESLKTLLDARMNVVAVITAPDKPSGRGKKVLPLPVKEFAKQADIPFILQPVNLKDQDFITKLKTLNADLYIVVAFRMLPEIVWSIPPLGTINLHASLLPDYRGAAPINWAIINGEKITGVTTFFIEKDIDTGNIIFQDTVEITPDMNAGVLHDLLQKKGAQLLIKTIDAIETKQYPKIPQEKLLTGKTIHPAPKIMKEDCRINWNKNAASVYNFIRGLSPCPAAWTILHDGTAEYMVKIYENSFEESAQRIPAGTLLTDGINYLKVTAADGFIDVRSLQLSGKNRMDIKQFLRGFKQISKCKIIR